MSTIYYYPHLPTGDIEQHPFHDLMYDLEPIKPPHTQYKSDMSLCPAMLVNQSHTYLIRSPIDFNINYNYQSKKWATQSTTQEISDLMMVHDDRKPYLQIAFYYLFWSEKKSNTQLWMHDVPLHEVNHTPTWYIASGMIPVGEYVRNTSVGLILKPDETKIKVEKGQPLAAITLVDNEKVKLVKKKPPQRIIDTNIRNNLKPKYCPYTAIKTLFSRWL
jgi:hypothetical protein